MYAVILTGGKQYRVETGDVLEVEKLQGGVSDKLNLKILFKSDGETVTTNDGEAAAEILAHGKGKKITVYKYKAKKNVRKKQGHRQQFSKIKILSI
ncbi:MAG: 50S ribosomal protein L21 [Firmicutes bacterium]|nr:50S ribosomal protein L21 [Bacillota bacterium]